MKLVEHLQVRTPLLWITTDESPRVIDLVAESVTDRSVYRLDTLEGLVRWEPERRRWLKVLIDDGQGGSAPTGDLNAALGLIMDDRGTFILDHAHITAENLVGFYTAVQNLFRRAFWEDDKSRIPAQFVLLSCKDEIPPELRRDCIRIDFPLPTEEELQNIIRHLSTSSAQVAVGERDIKAIARAGLGMSESEFIAACLLDMNDQALVTSTAINAAKLENIKKEGMLEIRQPDLSVDDIGGLDNAKKLIQSVAWTWHNPEKAKEWGIRPLRRVLMVGVPGTGKSAICEATAKTLDLELAKGGVSNAMSKWVGESESNMRKMFKQLKAMKPIVFWVDELGRDLSGGASSGSVDGGTTDRVHGEFLTGLQEMPDEVFLMAAANRIDGLPPEMLRADRFDKILFVGFPTMEERVEIFKIHLGERHSTFNLQDLALASPQFTGAEIKALIHEVAFKVGAGEARMYTTDDLLAQIPRMKGRVWLSDRGPILDMYQRAMDKWEWASSGQEKEAEMIMQNGMAPVPLGRSLATPPKPQQPSEPKPDATYVPSSFLDKMQKRP